MAESLIPQAMAWKFPGAKCSKNADCDGVENWEHPTIPKPNRIQVIEILDEYKKHLRAVAFKEKRAGAYPPISDQLDALWKSGIFPEDSPAAKMQKEVLAVKSKFPKE